MELKDKIDIIGKKADIVSRKLIVYLAIAGGTWLYGIAPNKNVTIVILSSVGFLFASVGIYTNILKLTELQNKLKGLENG